MSAVNKLHVKSRAPHFWRAGIKFTRAGVDVDPSTLTAEQLDAIRAERNLIVTECTPGEEGAQGRGKQGLSETDKQPPSNRHPEGKSPRGDDQTPTTPTPAKPTKAKAKR